jgi:hypothetical protein
MGIAAMSKTSVIQVSGFFLLQHKRLWLDIIYFFNHIKYKNRVFCVQVKNKPCVVYTIMHLIPWKQSHGSKTGTADKCRSHKILNKVISRKQ